VRAGEIDPERERTHTAGLRDVLAGLALLALGHVATGSTLDWRADALDYVFDGLALAWIAWGALRIAVRAR
jgi:hypothetical protein